MGSLLQGLGRYADRIDRTFLALIRDHNMADQVQPTIASAHAAVLTRGAWRDKARFFHEEDICYLRFLIPRGLRILELGCGAGHTLAALEPAYGLGIDIDRARIIEGRAAFPALDLRVGDIEDEATLAAIEGTFDVILIVDTLGSITDVQALLERLHRFTTRETRLVMVYFSHLWIPLLKLAEAIGWKMPQGQLNVLSPKDIETLAALANFDAIKAERRMLSPMRLLGLGRVVNRFLAPLPLIRHLTLRHYSVARSWHAAKVEPRSATVVIPARNERGNIEPAIARMPSIAERTEVIFVEGHSHDGTLEEMHRVAAAHPEWDIKVMIQPREGKADAVFTGFDAASGDVLIILDADLTMPPEQLPKFWEAIRTGRGEFINGSRLVYPMGDEAMRFLNLIANRLFSLFFSWLLNQRYTDTLCGTKVLWRTDYQRLKAGRTYFGDFDPFGDFDLIFGASKLSLKTVEVPIRYAARAYGKTQISRFRHGWILLKMAFFAFFKMKAL
jgi:SAM-dependent methyltransferase